MLDANTATKLRDMRLGTMAETFDGQLSDSGYGQMSFEERFGLIVDAEWVKRQNSRMSRLIRNANYAISGACVEDIDYREDRNLDRNLIKRLETCGYVEERRNILILGPTGAGKTYLANALGMAASRKRYAVKYAKLPDLLSELAIARDEGNYRKAVKPYRQARLLILDEWLLFPLQGNEAKELFNLVDARMGEGASIICSQFDVKGWHEKIGETAVADAICDRVATGAHRIVIGGRESMRKREAASDANA
ncbi:MAG: IS21-like element helper ATPase IstB [Treponema sp.]|jgi:DNA replication protein DnaC|nr:IS21-like element helper ATPase IstB [Treponema sp.]